MSGGQSPGQMTIYDFPEALPEPRVGEWVKTHGAVICHIMRRSYIGKKVVIDKSTSSAEWFRVGILEDYIEVDGGMRSIVYTGERQRHYIDHRFGLEIYEPMPWDWYDRRKK